jgi:hypothetical protein
MSEGSKRGADHCCKTSWSRDVSVFVHEYHMRHVPELGQMMLE